MALICKNSNLSATRPHLLGLPREIRDLIYGFVSASEQEQHLEILETKDNTTVFCMPLQKIRPSPLLHACQHIRQEYLDFYFGRTCFRIDVHLLAGLPSGDHCNQCPKCDEIGEIERWLNASVDIVLFRRLQLTFIDHNGTARGANVDVVYEPGAKAFKVEYVKQFNILFGCYIGPSSQLCSWWR